MPPLRIVMVYRAASCSGRSASRIRGQNDWGEHERGEGPEGSRMETNGMKKRLSEHVRVRSALLERRVHSLRQISLRDTLVPEFFKIMLAKAHLPANWAIFFSKSVVLDNRSQIL